MRQCHFDQFGGEVFAFFRCFRFRNFGPFVPIQSVETAQAICRFAKSSGGIAGHDRGIGLIVFERLWRIVRVIQVVDY